MPPHIMISRAHIKVWDLDPKTPPVIHVTPHYKRKKFVFTEKSLVTRHFSSRVPGYQKTHQVFKKYAWIVNNGSCCISPRISDQSSANDNTQRLATTETTAQHGNFNYSGKAARGKFSVAFFFVIFRVAIGYARMRSASITSFSG